MSKYKYLLFDMDGTIADTDRMLFETMNILYDKYRDGVRTPREQIYYFSGPPISGTLKKEFPNVDYELIYKEFVRVSESLYASTITTYPDCREVLLDLKKHGYKLAVVTNKVKKLTLYCLEIIHLEDIFDVVIGFDDVKKCKPDAEGCLKALQLLGANDLSQALYLGDNIMDFETANNAGIDCALVAWGPRVLPSELKPVFKFSSYQDLRRKLDE